jgi:hypothetical protein
VTPVPAPSGRAARSVRSVRSAVPVLVVAAAVVLAAAVLLVGAAAPAGAAPASPGQSGPGGAADPCVEDASQATGAWDCLPFYRWADDADSFYSNYGPSEIGKANVMQPLVTFLYGMAGLMWRVLQWITRTALAFDLFNRGDGEGGSTPVPLQPVNDGYAMAADIALSGLGLLVLAVAVVAVVSRLARDGEHSARDLVRPFLCLGLLLFLLARAAPSGSGDAAAGSPAWLAERGVGMSNVVADRISQAAPRATAPGAPDNLLDCHYYVDEMQSSFDEARGGGDLVGSVAFQPHLASLMSSLWEAAYLDLWIGAQFGDDEALARRAYCRMLEDRSDIPPSQQAAIQAAAFGSEGAAVPAAGLGGSAPFGRFNDDKDFRRGMVAWGTCGWYPDRSDLQEEADGRLTSLSGPGFAVNPEFRLMWNLGSPPSESRESTCSDWWGTDGSGTTKPDPRGTKWGVRDGDGPFQFGTAGDIDEAFTVYGDEELAEATAGGGGFGLAVAPYAEADRENLPEARDWVFALNGHNLPSSVPHAFLAIVIAGIYLWAIGGLALGTLVAQFLTVLFFVALPLLLVLGMWPTEGARRLFWRYVRLGAGSLFAKVAFVSLLAVLLLLISVINALGALTGAFGAAGGSGLTTGLGTAMLQAAAPVAAIWAMRWALKDLGMGNIFSLKGAMALTGRLTRGDRDGAPGPDGAPGRSVGDRSRESVRRRLDRRWVLRESRRRSAAGTRGAAAGARAGTDAAGKDAAAGGGRLRRVGAAAAARIRGRQGGEAKAGAAAARSSPRARGAALLGTVASPSRFNPQAVRDGLVPAAAGGLVLAGTPLAGALFGFPPVAGAVALAAWAARRSGQGRDGTDDVPADHGRAPTADEMAGAPEGGIGAAYGRHVEAIAAAGNGADPTAAGHHPDVTPPPLTTGREVTAEGAVHAVTSTRRTVPLPTPGWAARDGEAFAARRGYRDHQGPAAAGPRAHRRRHLPGGNDDHGRARRAGRH